MPRFYCALPLVAGATVPLPPEIVRHLHVLRLTEGDGITLFDGNGGEYAAKLASIDKKHASAALGAHSPREAELPFALTLAQALPEGSKMDWIVEKAVELGVAAIQPLAAQRSVVKLSGERAEKRRDHWQAIIVAASEQCGRNRLARLEPLTDFSRWMAQPSVEPRILFSPRATQTLAGWAREHQPQPVTLAIGPEGGFSPEEEAAAVANGATLLSLGERVLRTETAGMAAVSMLAAVWERC
ncbi:MAG: rRNA methyltransferase [Burkholderiaceae bacterium]|nr:rRNA methyltransferase [Burkholderiaceae bacterium]